MTYNDTRGNIPPRRSAAERRSAAARSMWLLMALAASICCLMPAGCVRDDALVPEEVYEPFWMEVEGLFREEDMNCMASDGNGRLYIGTEERASFGELVITYDWRYFYSENWGDTWSERSFEHGEIKSIETDTEGRVYFTTSHGSVYRSVDYGASWQRIWDSDAVEAVSMAEGRILLRCAGTGLYLGQGSGTTWDISLEGGFKDVAAGPDGRVTAVTDSSLHISGDNGDSWISKHPPIEEDEGIVTAMTGNSGETYIVTYLKHDTDRGRFYASFDDGSTLTEMPLLNCRGDESVLAVTPGGDILYGNQYYLYISEDGGSSWRGSLNDYRYDEELHPYDIIAGVNNEIFTFNSDDVFRSRDGGESWTFIAPPWRYIQSIVEGPEGVKFFSSYRSGIFTTDDDFTTVSQFNGGLGSLRVLSLIKSEDDSLIVTTANNGLFKTSAYAQEWTYRGPERSAITAACQKDLRLAAAREREDIFLSEDSGASWVSLGMEGYRKQALLFNGEGNIFLGTRYGGVFRNTGGTAVWEQLNDGIEGLINYDLEIDPDGSIYACTDNGVYIFDSQDEKWLPDGLNGEAVVDITKTDSGTLYALRPTGVSRKRPGWPSWREVEGARATDLRGYKIMVDGEGYIWVYNDYIYRSKSPVE